MSLNRDAQNAHLTVALSNAAINRLEIGHSAKDKSVKTNVLIGVRNDRTHVSFFKSVLLSCLGKNSSSPHPLKSNKDISLAART